MQLNTCIYHDVSLFVLYVYFLVSSVLCTWFFLCMYMYFAIRRLNMCIHRCIYMYIHVPLWWCLNLNSIEHWYMPLYTCTIVHEQWMCLGMQRHTHITRNNLIPISVPLFCVLHCSSVDVVIISSRWLAWWI